MPFTLSLEDEDGQPVIQLTTELLIETAVELSRFKLLRYLDPYGNTMFNRLQMDDLLFDLSDLASVAPQPVIAQVIKLAEQCKNSVHCYLWFYGD